MQPTNDILSIIADNPNLFAAVKAEILEHFDMDTEIMYQQQTFLPDEHLGQHVRARLIGKSLVEEAFREIAQYKTKPDAPPLKNPAR